MFLYSSYQFIDILRTHIGVSTPTNRTLHALILMSAAAEYIRYTDLDFLIDFYYRIYEEPHVSQLSSVNFITMMKMIAILKFISTYDMNNNKSLWFHQWFFNVCDWIIIVLPKKKVIIFLYRPRILNV